MTTQAFFNELKGSDKGQLRGISLGMSIDQVIEIEGKNFDRKLGLYPHLRYKREIGEAEDLLIYYYFDKKKKTITGIDLFCHSLLYDLFEYNKNDKEPQFASMIRENNETLKTLALKMQHSQETFSEIFTKKYGKPSTSNKKSGKNKVHLSTWESTEEELQIRLYYFLDKSKDYTEDICQTLKISISKLK